jgi:hypothetical protein
MDFSKDLYLLRYAIGEMDFWELLNWAVLVAVSIVLWRALRAQNRRYAQLVGEGEYYSEESHSLFKLAQARGAVLFWLWIVLVTLLIIIDVSRQIDRSRNYVLASENSSINNDKANPPIDEEYQGEGESETKDLSQNQPSIANIKSSYEDAFVSLLILQKCKLAGEAEEKALYAALYQALSSSGQPEKIAKSVMGAASGSYHSLYDGVKCDGAAITNTQTNFALFMKQVETE